MARPRKAKLDPRIPLVHRLEDDPSGSSLQLGFVSERCSKTGRDQAKYRLFVGVFNAIGTRASRESFVLRGYPSWWHWVTGGLEIHPHRPSMG